MTDETPATWKSMILGSSKKLDEKEPNTAQILNAQQDAVRQARRVRVESQTTPLVNHIIDECFSEVGKELGENFKTINISELYSKEDSSLLKGFTGGYTNIPKPNMGELYNLIDLVIVELESEKHGFIVSQIDDEKVIIDVFWEVLQ